MAVDVSMLAYVPSVVLRPQQTDEGRAKAPCGMRVRGSWPTLRTVKQRNKKKPKLGVVVCAKIINIITRKGERLGTSQKNTY
jgi:hypothetical protein